MKMIQPPGVVFKNVHPTRTAGRKHKGIDLPNAGLVTKGNESRRVSCIQCGFSGCDMERDPIGVSEGDSNVAYDTETVGSESVTVEAKRAGCPFCNSSNYAP